MHLCAKLCKETGVYFLLCLVDIRVYYTNIIFFPEFMCVYPQGCFSTSVFYIPLFKILISEMLFEFELLKLFMVSFNSYLFAVP